MRKNKVGRVRRDHRPVWVFFLFYEHFLNNSTYIFSTGSYTVFYIIYLILTCLLLYLPGCPYLVYIYFPTFILTCFPFYLFYTYLLLLYLPISYTFLFLKITFGITQLAYESPLPLTKIKINKIKK